MTQKGSIDEMRSETIWLIVLILVAHVGMGFASPLGKPGTVASYELNADLADRPEYERERQLTVI
ncbi:MAG TPA: hypothetical protein PKH07_05275, partial [bacterium]|nr:hypothetical protein [bacterium]